MRVSCPKFVRGYDSSLLREACGTTPISENGASQEPVAHRSTPQPPVQAYDCVICPQTPAVILSQPVWLFFGMTQINPGIYDSLFRDRAHLM